MRKSKYGKILYFVVAALAVCMLFLQSCDIGNDKFPEQSEQNGIKIYNEEKYVLKENVETFLVLGLDKFGDDVSDESYNNNQQADFLLLFVLDNEAKTCSAIHINRDTMVDIDRLGVAGNKMNTVRAQIALAHTEGNGREVSCRNTAHAVSRLLDGIKVNHYLSMSMDGVAILNDCVGGVELTLLEDLTEFYGGFAKGETVTLKGEQALTYIRERKDLGDGSNVSRMERQRQYMNALYGKFLKASEKDGELISKASTELAGHIVSDRSVNQLQNLTDKFNEYEYLGIITPKGETKLIGKHMEFNADTDDINKIVVSLFYEKIE